MSCSYQIADCRRRQDENAQELGKGENTAQLPANQILVGAEPTGMLRAASPACVCPAILIVVETLGFLLPLRLKGNLLFADE
jgi:hypothetical protein